MGHEQKQPVLQITQESVERTDLQNNSGSGSTAGRQLHIPGSERGGIQIGESVKATLSERESSNELRSRKKNVSSGLH